VDYFLCALNIITSEGYAPTAPGGYCYCRCFTAAEATKNSSIFLAFHAKLPVRPILVVVFLPYHNMCRK